MFEEVEEALKEINEDSIYACELIINFLDTYHKYIKQTDSNNKNTIKALEHTASVLCDLY